MMGEYSVVSSFDYQVFCNRVKALQAEGWRLQGGVSVAHNTRGHPIYYQAMVR